MLLERPPGRPRALPIRPEDASERLAGWCLGGPLTAGLVLLSVVQLAAWLPHYLTWPLWSDHDVFATMAHGWDLGLLPYRDLRGNNFPGTIYLFWLAGRLAGWGRTWAFYAIDAALLVGLGLAMLGWSRARFGRLSPGAVGLAATLGYYFNLDYTQVAQRDWQGPLCAVLGILAAESWPGRRGRFAAAALAASALAIRPQTVLLLPAMAFAVGAGGGRVPARALGAWSVATLVFVAIAFAPLAWSGVLGDFARGVRAASVGGTYYRVTPATFASEMARQLTARDLATAAAVLLLLGGVSITRETRDSSRTWLLGLASVLLYRPLSPCPHAYLDHPRMLVSALNLATLAALVLEARPLPDRLRLAALLVVLGMGGSLRPTFVNPVMAAGAISDLRAGRVPEIAPMGYRGNPAVLLAARYEWSDYRAVLDYLRDHTDPRTRVANALEGVPALTGPAALRSAFPAESIAWLRVRPEDEDDFAEALRGADDSVVVWSPAEGEGRAGRTTAIEGIEAVIRERYVPEALFGEIEVWRRAR